MECEGLITGHLKSGYSVNEFFPESFTPKHKSLALSTSSTYNELIEKVYNNLNDQTIMHFSNGSVDAKYLPIAKLNKNLFDATRYSEGNGLRYGELQGNVHLRRNISKRSYYWGIELNKEDLITTTGATNAVALALSALTKPGDSIAVESPCYFIFLQLANSLGLKIIEIPTDPEAGVTVSALEAAVKDIKACILISNFNYPLGYCMSDDNKKQIVDLLDANNVPLIEDDVYGDIYFGTNRPKPCKAWDKSGNVIWCSSISISLAPGYRVGWMAPGKYRTLILNKKQIMELSTPSPTQEAVALFLENERYELYLRKIRNNIHFNSLKFYETIMHSFPLGTKAIPPKGGFMIWVVLPENVNTIELYNRAIIDKISFTPGRMFTLQNRYTNCMRLSFAHSWTPNVEKCLIHLGELSKKLTAELI